MDKVIIERCKDTSSILIQRLIILFINVVIQNAFFDNFFEFGHYMDLIMLTENLLRFLGKHLRLIDRKLRIHALYDLGFVVNFFAIEIVLDRVHNAYLFVEIHSCFLLVVEGTEHIRIELHGTDFKLFKICYIPDFQFAFARDARTVDDIPTLQLFVFQEFYARYMIV